MPASSARATDWLTADEAVAFVGLPSRRALYMAVRRGQLPVHRMGRRMRFSARELDETLRRAGPRPSR
jgi:excisionase family DNA binding protein